MLRAGEGAGRGGAFELSQCALLRGGAIGEDGPGRGVGETFAVLTCRGGYWSDSRQLWIDREAGGAVEGVDLCVNVLAGSDLLIRFGRLFLNSADHAESKFTPVRIP